MKSQMTRRTMQMTRRTILPFIGVAPVAGAIIHTEWPIADASNVLVMRHGSVTGFAIRAPDITAASLERREW